MRESTWTEEDEDLPNTLEELEGYLEGSPEKTVGECPICLEEGITLLAFSCCKQHSCFECGRNWRWRSRKPCPFCRRTGPGEGAASARALASLYVVSSPSPSGRASPHAQQDDGVQGETYPEGAAVWEPTS
jgi:hypothetical protein